MNTLHPHLEFWTYSIANGGNTKRFGYLGKFYQGKTSVWALTETLPIEYFAEQLINP